MQLNKVQPVHCNQYHIAPLKCVQNKKKSCASALVSKRTPVLRRVRCDKTGRNNALRRRRRTCTCTPALTQHTTRHTAAKKPKHTYHIMCCDPVMRRDYVPQPFYTVRPVRQQLMCARVCSRTEYESLGVAFPATCERTLLNIEL